jgi:hypothetical protein
MDATHERQVGIATRFLSEAIDRRTETRMPTDPRLARHEIALIKKMLAREDFTKDRIQSYFSRPDRTVNFGRLTDIGKGKLGGDVEAADDKTVQDFIASFDRFKPFTEIEADPLSRQTLAGLFRLHIHGKRLERDESDTFEAKETFYKGGPNFAKYAKTAAGFANAAGGYLVFGIKDGTLEIVGLPDDRFLKIDKAEITQKFGQHLTPAITWDRTTFDIAGKTVGIIHVPSSTRKPIVSRSDVDGLRDGAIYYRYIGETREVRSAELHELMTARDRRAGEELAKVVTRASSIGVENIGLLDVDTGIVEGNRGSFLIDESLLPKISFIKEGDFEQVKGAPALRLVGSVESVDHDKLQTTYISGRAISEHDIVRHAIDMDVPGDPKEFIRQQMHLQFKKLPLYFFAVKAGMSRVQLIELIETEQDTSLHTKEKLLQRARNSSPPPAASDLISKLTNGDAVRITPENAIGVCKAIQAMTPAELTAFDAYRVMKTLLTLYAENPSAPLYLQVRYTATYVDDVIFNPQLA